MSKSCGDPYAFNPSAAPAHLRALIGGKINQAMIERNWPDILRIAATIAAGGIAPSQILRKTSKASCAGVIDPSTIGGQTNLLRSRRFANRHRPLPFQCSPFR